MKSSSFIVLALLFSTSIGRAQNLPLAVNVYKPVPEHGTIGSVKLYLGGRELPGAIVQSPPDVALHVVFVLDNGNHQQGMMKLANDYVAALASDVKSSNVTFTVLLAASEPMILKETNIASELTLGTRQSRIAQNSSKDESADLRVGLTKAVQLLESSAGIRVVIMISDDDDDIAGQEVTSLKSQLANSRVLLYSILLAQHDFFGSRTHARRGSGLYQISGFSGGGQYETDWQQRNADTKILSAVAERISGQSLISFSLPSGNAIKPGISTLKAKFSDDKHKISTSPAMINH